MKKRGFLLIVFSFVLMLSGITANARGENRWDNRAPVSITEDSVLILKEEDGFSFELTVPDKLGYQEIVFPHGTDLSSKEFFFGYEKIQFSMTEEDIEAHKINKEYLNSKFGYYDNFRRHILPYETTYSKNGEAYEYVDRWDPLKLEDGATYTINLDNECGTREKKEWSSDTYRYFAVTQARKFSFKVRIAEPEVLEGKSFEFAEGTEKECVIRVDKDFAAFEGVKCNGTLLEEGTDYTAKSGSTVITLTPEYVKSLKVGDYEIKVVFNDCESEAATIKVTPAENKEEIESGIEDGREQEPVEEKKEEKKEEKIPKTGDTNNFWMWLVVILVSGSVVCGIVLEERKRKMVK